MNQGVIKVPLAPVRLENSDKSEMISEFLFGEPVRILEEKNNWIKCASFVDEYTGWIDKRMFYPVNLDRLTSIYRSEKPLETIHSPFGELKIPAGSWLYPEINVFSYTTQESMLKPADWAKTFLGAPYRWGGKSILGIDCSGLTQLSFSLAKQKIPRDAYLQAEIGEGIPFVDVAETNDLAFFNNAEGRITHVGIVLKADGESKIIHASGNVRIDKLDHQGIFNEEIGQYSHNLRFIKRVAI
ncbi:MAG: hydrolase Nlp/P60 [Cryomorphaceae bacterium]|nr:hydrolase Nlp/P60 [Cryomorphaceae bacterium]